jgi:hypothetical protein
VGVIGFLYAVCMPDAGQKLSFIFVCVGQIPHTFTCK